MREMDDEGQYTAESAYYDEVVAPFEKSIRKVSAPLAGTQKDGGGVVATAAPAEIPAAASTRDDGLTRCTTGKNAAPTVGIRAGEYTQQTQSDPLEQFKAITNPDCQYYGLSVCKGDCAVCELRRANLAYAVRHSGTTITDLVNLVDKVSE